MSTSTVESPKKESLLQSIEEVLVPSLKITENKFYLTVNWKILATRILDEREINLVINRISEFYQRFLEKKGTRLHSFDFRLDANKETGHFCLRVDLSSDIFIHTSALTPVGLDLDGCAGDGEDGGLQFDKLDLGGPPQNNGGTVPVVHTPIAAQLQSVSLAYASAPPQNTGHTGPGTL